MKHTGSARFCIGFLTIFLLFSAAPWLYPQTPLAGEELPRGDAAMALRYAQWAKDAVDGGRWSEALAGLERAADFSDVSSDISYLLALARSHENKNRHSVLEALERSLAVNVWNLYESEAARLMMAENLIALKAYSRALDELSGVRKSPEEAVLTLKALALFNDDEFRRYLTETLDRYPRETGPARVFLNYLKNKDAASSKDDLELLELIIRRLPVLLFRDPELAWMAAPFVRDRDDGRRLVMAYRAVNKPAPASLPIALALGVIDDTTALEELFSGGVTSPGKTSPGVTSLDMALLNEIWDLLSREETQAAFRRNLSVYSGVITKDADRDGFPETSVEYYRGAPELCTYDADQNGEPEIILYFEAGIPVRAQVQIPPEAGSGSPGTAGSAAKAGSTRTAAVQWERYPSVLEVEFDGARYIPRPLDFHFSPFMFIELWRGALLFPHRDVLSPPLTRRVLVTHVYRIERPSLEFSGGIEVVELSQGIPIRAREYVGELKVSETDFLRGRPQLQWLDLNFDGKMDTVRRFNRVYRPMELEELWDYDRDIESSVTVDDLEMEW